MLDLTHCTDPARRHDFALLFDVTDGNPNGDPDMDNTPRMDAETNYGLVTDVCIKRKVRNYVSLTQPDAAPNRIYVQDRGVYLNDLHSESHKAVGIPEAKAKDPDRGKRDEARAWMCKNFYDVRMFGAVMSTGVNSGQVRGPMQLTFSRSQDPILPMDIAVTRVALTNEKERKGVPAEENSEGERASRTGTIGRKSIVPYGLYRGHGFFSPAFAKQTGVTSDDLELFWTALINAWDLDHSAARGLMSCRGLYVFSHHDPKGLGNAPAHKLFDRLSVTLDPEIETPRHFADYKVLLNKDTPHEAAPQEQVYENIVEGVTLTVLSAG